MTISLANQEQFLLGRILHNTDSASLPAHTTMTRKTRVRRTPRRARLATRVTPTPPITPGPAPAVANLSFGHGTEEFDSVAALAADTGHFCGNSTEPGRIGSPSDRIVGSFAKIDPANLAIHCDEDVLGPLIISDHATAWSALGFADAAATIGFDHAGMGDDVLPGAVEADAAGGRDSFRLITGCTIDLTAACDSAAPETEIWGMGDDVLPGAANDRVAAIADDRLCA